MVEDFARWRHFVIAKLGENHDMCIVGVVSDGLEAVLKAEANAAGLDFIGCWIAKAKWN